MKIISMRNVDWSKNGNPSQVKAILTIKCSDGFEMKNFKLVEGQNGLFVGSPSTKGKDNKYYDSIWIPQDKRNELNQEASEIFDPNNPVNETYPEFKKEDEKIPF